MTSATPEPATGVQSVPSSPAPTSPHYRTGNKNARNLYQVNPDGSETHIGCTFHEHAGPLVVEALNQWEQRKQDPTAAVHLPADWRTQVTSVASWMADEVVALIEEWQAG